MRVLWILTFVSLVVTSSLPDVANGQIHCDFGSVSHVMEAGNARIRVSNNGWLFRTVPYTEPTFEVPARGGVNAFFNAQPWIAGTIGDELVFTGSGYSSHFYPGPVGSDGLSTTDCVDHDRIFSISKADLLAFDAGDDPGSDFLQWPFDLGAPVIDGNGKLVDYEPSEGDRPGLLGGESVWWKMNDGGISDSVHHQDGRHVGLDVSVFTAILDNTPPDVVVMYLRYTYKYVRNATLEDAYIGFFADPVLGDFDDDASAIDTLSNTAFTYNFSESDPMYGKAPPAIAVALLKGPRADLDGRDNDRDGIADEEDERLGVSGFIGRADEPHEFHSNQKGYNHLKGLCGQGHSIQVNSDPNGPSGCYQAEGQETSFWYTGDPVSGTGWLKLYGGDETFVMTSGPFTWRPGETQEIEYAVIWARGQSNLDSVSRVRQIARALQTSPELFDLPLRTDSITNQTVPTINTFMPAYPNPADESATIEYEVVETARVTITLFDTLGRKVKDVVDHYHDAGSHSATINTTGLPSGVYLYRIAVGQFSSSRTLSVLH